MKKTIKTLSLFAAIAFSFASEAKVISSYDFNGDLSDSLGNNVNLSEVGLAGYVENGRYYFDTMSGLELSLGSSFSDEYFVEMSFNATDLWNGWEKFIDMGGTSESGLYFNYGANAFVNYGYSFNSGDVGNLVDPLNNEVLFGMAVKDGTTGIYINGQLIGQHTDNPENGSFMRFFLDNTTESFSGSSDYIRIHDSSDSFATTANTIVNSDGTLSNATSVPLPASIAFLALGLVGLSRRKKK